MAVNRDSSTAGNDKILIWCSLSFAFGRDLWELRGHPSGALAAAVAGEWHSALPHPPSGRRPEPPRTDRRPGQRFHEGRAPHPAHLCDGKNLLFWEQVFTKEPSILTKMT